MSRAEPTTGWRTKQEVWESWAQADPLWAILSDPARRGRRWTSMSFSPPASRTSTSRCRRRAGSGSLRGEAGRLTSVAASAGDSGPRRGVRARRWGRHLGHHDRAGPHLQPARRPVSVPRQPGQRPGPLRRPLDGLRVLDHRASARTSQHAATYITDFVRLLAPGGAAVFDMTAALRPIWLPQGAHRASIRAVDTPDTLVAGSRVPFTVVVTNESDFTWPAGSATRLGNHWQTAQGGDACTLDDGRTSIVALDVDPGGFVGDGRAVVAVPKQPGHYRLELDLVEEGVTWFADQGSAMLRLPVQVEGIRPSLRDRLAWRRRRATDASVTSDETEPEPFSMNAGPGTRWRRSSSARVARSCTSSRQEALGLTGGIPICRHARLRTPLGPVVRSLVDATALPANRGGVGRYVDELVARLPGISVSIFTLSPSNATSGLRGAVGARPSPPGPRAIGAARAAGLGADRAPGPRSSPRPGRPALPALHDARGIRRRRPPRVVVTLHDATFFSNPELHLGVKAQFFRTWSRLAARWADASRRPRARPLARRWSGIPVWIRAGSGWSPTASTTTASDRRRPLRWSGCGSGSAWVRTVRTSPSSARSSRGRTSQRS